MKIFILFVFILCCFQRAFALLPPRFQWKIIDFAWEGDLKDKALSSKAYIAQNNLPTGLARWKDKLFITIPRWKKGVPSSLNFVYLNDTQQPLLHPYPSWEDAFILDTACHVNTNASVVSAFRVHVDKCDRLWVVDNGATDMMHGAKQITDPAILVFNLNTDTLLHRFDLTGDVLRGSSVLTSIVVDQVGKSCSCDTEAYAYITDMGSNAIIVYSLKKKEAWRVENHYFHFDPHAGEYRVGGLDFYWSDGISSAALSPTKSDGHRDLYFHPTSSTKQFRMSTKLLRNKNVPKEDIFNGVEVVGEKGPFSQSSACDFDHKNNILFYTLLCKNAIGCWNSEKLFTKDNIPELIEDCNMLDFPSDLKVDKEGNLWILSNRQANFLYDSLDFNQMNFRVLTAPITMLVQGSPCERISILDRAKSVLSWKSIKSCKSTKSNKSSKSDKAKIV